MKKEGFPTLIKLEGVEAFQGYLITWFANVASTYLINLKLSSLTKDEVSLLCQEADNYVRDLKTRKPEACEEVPVPLTQNDEPEYFDLCKAVEFICDYARGKPRILRLEPAFSLEFTEYVRSFIPKITSKTLKREVVGVESILHGLAVIGAHISRAYIGRESGYVFVDVPNPAAIDYRKLSGMIITITREVINNNGSKLSLLVGIASAMALIYGRELKNVSKEPQLGINFVRLSRTGNRIIIKAFEVIDLTSLASRVYRLGIASPIYNMISRYPPEKHVLRSFIERLSKAIIIYELLNDHKEIYATLRALTSEKILGELRNYYKERSEIIDDLLKIRI